MIELLFPHLQDDDDPSLWRVAVEHIVAELPKKQGTLVEIGRCSHWLRPHQSHWLADGRFALPVGYGNGTEWFGRAPPQFDWSVVLAWTGERWELANDKSTRLSLRVAIPSRTVQHQQAAVHTLWMTGKEKETRFYGFRKQHDEWHCTAETEWREDKPAHGRR